MRSGRFCEKPIKMSDEGFDPCECVWNHLSVQHLLSIVSWRERQRESRSVLSRCQKSRANNRRLFFLPFEHLDLFGQNNNEVSSPELFVTQ